MERFLLVDDRGGRILAVIDELDVALRVLGDVEEDDQDLAQAPCLVKFDEHPGTLIGTETTWRVRSLT